MNNQKKIHEYLLNNLEAWKPKTGNPTISGEGFNDMNVLRLEPSSLPTAHEYDLVYIRPPIIAAQGITTGSQGVQRSTETYTIDLYTKRGGQGNTGRLNTMDASYENTNKISDLLSKQGFILTMPQADLNYANTLIARQVINATRTFIKQEE